MVKVICLLKLPELGPSKAGTLLNQRLLHSVSQEEPADWPVPSAAPVSSFLDCVLFLSSVYALRPVAEGETRAPRKNWAVSITSTITGHRAVKYTLSGAGTRWLCPVCAGESGGRCMGLTEVSQEPSQIWFTVEFNKYLSSLRVGTGSGWSRQGP